MIPGYQHGSGNLRLSWKSEKALRLTPVCRLRSSLRSSLRPTLGPSRRLLRNADGAPSRRASPPVGRLRRPTNKRVSDVERSDMSDTLALDDAAAPHRRLCQFNPFLRSFPRVLDSSFRGKEGSFWWGKRHFYPGSIPSPLLLPCSGRNGQRTPSLLR